jgi:RNA polymerase sigma factor (sigma-70 family)
MFDLQGAFPPTHWSLVLNAGDRTSPEADEALERLCRTYRQPVLAFLRHQGIDPSNAEDLAQEFFSSLIRRNSLARVAPERGRFRSYLKACLRYFLIDHFRATRSEPEKDWIQLHDSAVCDPSSGSNPVDALDHEWAEHVLHLAYQRLEGSYRDPSDRSWFESLRPFLSEDPAPGDYARLASTLNLPPNTIAKRVQRLREELDDQIRAELLDTVGTPAEVEREIRALFS